MAKKQDTFVTIRISTDTYKRIVKLAAQELRSVSQYLRILIEHSLAADSRKP